MTESPGAPQSPVRTAAAVSLVLHAAAILALWTLPGRPDAPPEPPDAIDVLLRSPEAREPRLFTELPPERADEAPETPDFLGNVDSRARDDAPGGEEPLPRSDGEADSPQVELVEADPAPPLPAPRAGATPDAATALAAAAGDIPPAAPAPAEPELSVRSMVGQDIRQQAMRNPSGNAGLTGEFSLSTTAWDYAPWFLVFRREVMQRWLAPVAYRMGLIDGWVLIRAEIARDGSLLAVEVLEADVGNPSLTDAAVYALKAPAPYHKLPADFPHPTLVVTARFAYPALRRD